MLSGVEFVLVDEDGPELEHSGHLVLLVGVGLDRLPAVHNSLVVIASLRFDEHEIVVGHRSSMITADARAELQHLRQDRTCLR